MIHTCCRGVMTSTSSFKQMRKLFGTSGLRQFGSSNIHYTLKRTRKKRKNNYILPRSPDKSSLRSAFILALIVFAGCWKQKISYLHYIFLRIMDAFWIGPKITSCELALKLNVNFIWKHIY